MNRGPCHPEQPTGRSSSHTRWAVSAVNVSRLASPYQKVGRHRREVRDVAVDGSARRPGAKRQRMRSHQLPGLSSTYGLQTAFCAIHRDGAKSGSLR